MRKQCFVLAKKTAMLYFQGMDTYEKYIAIDYGTKRVGLAVCSTQTGFVFPLRTLDRSVKKIFFEQFSALVEEQQPSAFILGLPFHEDGSPCITTSQVKNFAASLARRYPQPIYFMEELLSSFDAEYDMRSQGLSSKKIKEKVDQEASVRILESFLASPKKIRFAPRNTDYSENKKNSQE